MDSNLKKMARAGYVAKATVYGIMGVLTFMAAFNMGGQKSSNLQVIEFLEKQPFGNALLVLIGLGLLCYSAWRFIQAIKDPENIGEDKEGNAAVSSLIGYETCVLIEKPFNKDGKLDEIYIKLRKRKNTQFIASLNIKFYSFIR